MQLLIKLTEKTKGKRAAKQLLNFKIWFFIPLVESRRLYANKKKKEKKFCILKHSNSTSSCLICKNLQITNYRASLDIATLQVR